MSINAKIKRVAAANVVAHPVAEVVQEPTPIKTVSPH